MRFSVGLSCAKLQSFFYCAKRGLVCFDICRLVAMPDISGETKKTPYYGGTPRLGRRQVSAGQAAGLAILGRWSLA